MLFQNYLLPRDVNGKLGTLNEWSLCSSKVPEEFLITKFGRNDDIDGPEDIWGGGGLFTGFPTAAVETLTVFSDNANDTLLGTGAQKIRVFYYDDEYQIHEEGKNEGYFYVDVEMNGITPVDTGIDVRRVWRVKVIQSGSGETNAGIITGHWTTTTAVVFFKVPAGFGQTQIAAFSVPKGHQAVLKTLHFTMNDNTANAGEAALRVREFGTNTFRTVLPGKVSTLKDYSLPPLIGGATFKEKTDIVGTMLSVTNANAVVTCLFELYLFRV